MYTKEIKIKSYDVDNNSHLKLSSIMKYFQQVARENLDELGFTYDYLRKLNIVFVLSKYKIKTYRPIKADEHVIIKTSPCEVRGVFFIRDFAVEDSNGTRLIEASSSWVIIDFEKRSVLRPNHFPGVIPTDERLVDFYPERTNVLEECSFSYTTNVLYSQLDSNNHLNNCVYADIMFDGICQNGHNVPENFEMDMSFDHEALLGDELVVNYYIDDTKKFYISCINNTQQNTCFTVVLTVK